MMDMATMARRVTEWRDSAILWKRRALEAEAALARVRRTVELNRGNRTAPYAGTSNYVPIADLEDALGEHVSPPRDPHETSRGPHVVPTSPRVVPTSDAEGAA